MCARGYHLGPFDVKVIAGAHGPKSARSFCCETCGSPLDPDAVTKASRLAQTVIDILNRATILTRQAPKEKR